MPLHAPAVFSYAVYGLVLVLILLLLPQGLIPTLQARLGTHRPANAPLPSR
jgi:branched-chain amino acid transport system permease protein